jgi:hypothetical protein
MLHVCHIMGRSVVAEDDRFVGSGGTRLAFQTKMYILTFVFLGGVFFLFFENAMGGIAKGDMDSCR